MLSFSRWYVRLLTPYVWLGLLNAFFFFSLVPNTGVSQSVLYRSYSAVPLVKKAVRNKYGRVLFTICWDLLTTGRGEWPQQKTLGTQNSNNLLPRSGRQLLVWQERAIVFFRVYAYSWVCEENLFQAWFLNGLTEGSAYISSNYELKHPLISLGTDPG